MREPEEDIPGIIAETFRLAEQLGGLTGVEGAFRACKCITVDKVEGKAALAPLLVNDAGEHLPDPGQFLIIATTESCRVKPGQNAAAQFTCGRWRVIASESHLPCVSVPQGAK